MATCSPIDIDLNAPCFGCPDPDFISEEMNMTAPYPADALIAAGIKAQNAITDLKFILEEVKESPGRAAPRKFRCFKKMEMKYDCERNSPCP